VVSLFDARLAAGRLREAELALALLERPMPIGTAPATVRPTVWAAPLTALAATVTPATPYTRPWRSTPRTRGENIAAAVAATATATSDSKKSSGIWSSDLDCGRLGPYSHSKRSYPFPANTNLLQESGLVRSSRPR
jgi:hypothetical protein